MRPKQKASAWFRALPLAAVMATLITLCLLVVLGPPWFALGILAALVDGLRVHNLGLVLAKSARLVLAFGIVFWGYVLLDIIAPEGLSVSGEPPADLGGRGPGAALDAYRRQGARSLLVLLVVGGVAVVVTDTWRFDAALVVELAVMVSVVEGLGAWAYFHWCQWRLSARGFLPRDLRAFLDLAATEQVGWLRVADGYEFRHRQLLEYLAPEVTAIGAGNLSLLEARARATKGGSEARRGDRLHRSKDYAGAAQAFADAAAAAPSIATHHLKLARALNQLGRTDEAVEAAGLAVDLAPDSQDAQMALGVAYERAGNLALGLTAFSAAATLSPTNAQAHANRAIVLGRLGRHEERLEALDVAIKLRPKNVAYQRMRATTLAMLGRSEEHLRALKDIAVLDSKDPASFTALAAAYEQLREYKEALEYAGRALSLSGGKDPVLIYNRAILLGRLERVDEELVALDLAISLNADVWQFHAARARALGQLGRKHEMLLASERADELRAREQATARQDASETSGRDSASL